MQRMTKQEMAEYMPKFFANLELLAKRSRKYKKCSICLERKPHAEFSTKVNSYRRSNICKECKKEEA